MYSIIFLEKVLYKFIVHIFTLLLAHFASKLVNYLRHSETLNFRKNSKSTTFSFENTFEHFPTFFKDSLCLKQLTNLDAKCAKRSVKMWGTNFYKIFSPISFLYLNGGLSKIRSVHTYTASQKHESTLLHTYVVKEFLTTDRSCKTIHFLKKLI